MIDSRDEPVTSDRRAVRASIVPVARLSVARSLGLLAADRTLLIGLHCEPERLHATPARQTGLKSATGPTDTHLERPAPAERT